MDHTKRVAVLTTCRECHKPIKHLPRLVFAYDTIKGGASLCLDCVIRQAAHYGFDVSPLRSFVPSYIKGNMDPAAKAKAELAYLRETVERLKRENADLRGQVARQR